MTPQDRTHLANIEERLRKVVYLIPDGQHHAVDQLRHDAEWLRDELCKAWEALSGPEVA